MWNEVAGMALAFGGALVVLGAMRVALAARGVGARRQAVVEMDLGQFQAAVRAVLVEELARERLAQSQAATVCERQGG